MADRIADIWGARTPHARDALARPGGLAPGRGAGRAGRRPVGPVGVGAVQQRLYGSWRHDDDDRVTRPLVRRSRELLAEVGPLSHGFYTSGHLFLEEYCTLGVIGKAGIGTPPMDGNTRLCTATAAAALTPASPPTPDRTPTVPHPAPKG